MSILRGPADADAYRVKVGRYGDRWYHDPLAACPLGEKTDAQWPSVSSVKNAAGDDWSFVALKRVAAAMHAGTTVKQELFNDTYDLLKGINKAGLRNAAARGTNVHSMFERGLRGQPVVDPMDGDAGKDYAVSVNAFFMAYRPELVAAELVCVNRYLNNYGYGGTADAIVRIDGKTYLVDWKSRGADSDHGCYPKEAAQLAAYSSADYYIAENGNGPERVPVPHLDGGLIVSIKPDGCRVFPVDLEKAQYQWVELHAWWAARRTEREPIGKPWAPRASSDPTPAASAAPSSPTVDIGLKNGLTELWREQCATEDAKIPVNPTLAGYAGALDGNKVNIEPRLDNLIRYAVDEHVLRALWALHIHEWTDTHTALAKTRKAELAS